MSTCRDVVTESLTAIKALAPGDDMTVDESASALRALQQLLLEWHEARGPMVDVDVSADYVAGADQRIRVQDRVTVTITLPNSVPLFVNWPWTDYGFMPSSAQPQAGATSAADSSSYRQPRDGERVEIVGTNQALYFYRADTNEWASVYSLTLDSTLPVNARNIGHWGARVAERMIDTWPGLFEPTPSLAKRIAKANSALLMRPGVARDDVRATYF